MRGKRSLQILHQRAAAVRHVQLGKQVSLVEVSDDGLVGDGAGAAGAAPASLVYVHWKDPIRRVGRSMPYGVRRWNRFEHFLKNVQWGHHPEQVYDGEIVHPAIGIAYKHGGDHQNIPEYVARLKIMWEISSCAGRDDMGHVCEFCCKNFLDDASAAVRTCALCMERSHEACGAFAAAVRSERFGEVDVSHYNSRDIVPARIQ